MSTDNTAPDEIAMDWEPGKAITSGPLFADPGITHWVRKDISDAAIAAARRDVLRLLRLYSGSWHPKSIFQQEYGAEVEDIRIRAMLKEDTDK